MSRAAAHGRLAALVLWSVAGFTTTPLGAQGPPPTEWSITGRVVLAASGRDLRPVPGVWVALNRVGDDSAGVIDSTRTGPDGGYRFVFRRTDDDAMYFTDVIHGGVAYFTDPLVGVNVTGEAAELVVFDTVSAPGMLRLRGRHAVVGPPDGSGERAVVEVFEVTNDTSLTVLARNDTQPVWSVALPDGAIDPEVGDGDVPATVVRFRRGRAELYAPMAPGLRQLSVRYTLPERDFPLTIILEQPVELLEVLLAGRAGTASGAGLHEEQVVEIEGDEYTRYLSTSAGSGDEVVLALGGGAAARLVVPAAIGTAVLLLAGALVYARRTAYPSADN